MLLTLNRLLITVGLLVSYVADLAGADLGAKLTSHRRRAVNSTHLVALVSGQSAAARRGVAP